MMPFTRAALVGTTAALLMPAAGQAATLTTDKPCYTQVKTGRNNIVPQRLTASGAGWAVGSTWGLTGEQINASGAVDAAGNFAAGGPAPIIDSTGFTPKKFTLTGTQTLPGETAPTPVATTTFSVVNFNVVPNNASGKPTATTIWHFSGFTPKKKIFFHLTKDGHTYTSAVGKAKSPCGTLKKRLNKLPGVPASSITYGKYHVYADQRRKFKKGGLQFVASIKIRKVFVR